MKRWSILLAAILVAVSAAAEPPAPTAAYEFTVGKLLVGEGEYRAAVDDFTRAVELEPADPYLHIEFADLLFRLGRMKRAVEEAEKAQELAPGNSDVLRTLGQIRLTQANQDPASLDAARETYEELRRLDPLDLRALLTLGRIYRAQGALEQAEEVLQEVVDERPGYEAGQGLLLQTQLELADKLSAADRHQEALEVLDRATEEMSHDPQLLRRKAIELFRLGRSQEADALVETLLADRSDRGLHLLHAVLLRDLGQSDRALAELQALHADDPSDSDVTHTLARLLAQSGAADEASRLLEETARRLDEQGQHAAAVSLRLDRLELLGREGRWAEVVAESDPLVAGSTGELKLEAAALKADGLLALDRNEEAWEALVVAMDAAEGEPPDQLVAKRAEVLYRLGRDSEAEREVAELVARQRPEAQLMAAEVYHRVKRYEASIPLLEGLLHEHPDSAAGEFLLASAYERTGRRQDAVSAFQKLIADNPQDHLALNYLGYMWAERGENLDQALDLVQRALDLDPGNGAYLDSLGWIYYQLGKYDEALRELQRAVQLVPDDATLQEHLGDTYRVLGHSAEAASSYRRALDLNSEDAEAVQRKLEGLEPAESAHEP